MKYCSYYGCDRLLPEDFSGDTCPYCKNKEYSWSKYIKDLPPEAKDVEQKCKKCGSTEELKYREIHRYGNNNQYSLGNEFECRPCDEAFRAELKRQEAMNYIVMRPDEDEIDFHVNKESVEKVFEEFFEDFWNEDGNNPFNDWVILKVEKLERFPKKSDFEKRNVIQYDWEWYVVEEIIEPEYEYTGDHNVSW